MIKNPIVPMVAITGHPSKEYIYSVIQENKRVGIDQFLIYPRSGLEVEYLSREWFSICRNIIEAAKKYEVYVWLYDEYNWPSGRCDQKVIESNPEFTGHALEVIKDKDNCTIKVVKGKTTDILNPSAVDKFIELTHEQYANEFSGYFGTVIKGFFTDEPSPHHNCIYDNAGILDEKEKNLCKLPYYIGMDEDYFRITQRDLMCDVQAYMSGSEIKDFGALYFELIGKKMKSSYVDKIRIWCEKHNLLSTGHFLHEDASYLATESNGNLLNNLIGMSMPSIDEIKTSTSFDSFLWETFACAKYASDTLGRCGMIELFAIGPCSMPLSKIRQMIWLSASFGLDHYLMAVSALDARGNKIKKYYYNPNNYMQPWFEAFTLITESSAKAAEYANKKDDRCIEVRYSQSLGANEAMRKKRDENYKPYTANIDLYKSLSSQQFQWHIIKEDDISSTEAKAVIKVLENGFLEEKSGQKFNSIDELIGFLDSKIERITVLNNSGQLAKNILLKTFEDGSILVIDMTDDIYSKSFRKLSIKKDNYSKTFQLYKRGVKTFDNYSESHNLIEMSLPIEVPDMKLELLNDNYVRCVFDKDTKVYKFYCEQRIADVRLAVLCQGEDKNIFLDRKKLVVDKQCNQLRKGFNNLYKTTGFMTLEKGYHEIMLGDNSEDYLYLPAVIICGSFFFYDNDTIGLVKNKLSLGSLKNRGLLNYAGTVKLTTDVYLPKIDKDVLLSVNTFGNFTRAFINGRELGAIGWEPYAFSIENKYLGKSIEISLEISTSIHPMFGDTLGIADKLSQILPWVSSKYQDTLDCDIGLIEPPKLMYGEFDT